MDTSGESDCGWPEGIRAIRQTLSGLYVADLALGDELVALSVINQASELLALGRLQLQAGKKAAGQATLDLLAHDAKACGLIAKSASGAGGIEEP